ncbi:MAG: hypothetical protein DDT20_00940 [Firmicutes bacterium]|nr:hypothetical protein [Bacillota bacterium]
MSEPKTEDDVKALVKLWFEGKNGWSYAPIQTGWGIHGIPDRVGFVPVVITPDMVGRRISVFVAIESKRPGRRNEKNRGLSTPQVLIADAIGLAGGVVEVVDGQEDLVLLDRQFHQPYGVSRA